MKGERHNVNIAIILAGGVGSRMGANIPKQYLKVGGKPIIQYCLETFVSHSKIDRIVICVAKEWETYVLEICDTIPNMKPFSFSRAGNSRQETIYNALDMLNRDDINQKDIIVIHDAVRPLVSAKLISDCIEICQDADGALPVITVKDTIYLSDDGKNILHLLNRDALFAGQAPEAFRFGKYFAIHQNMNSEQLAVVRGSSEIAYSNGLKINLFSGDSMNFKITTIEDLFNFEKIIENEG